MRVGTPKAGIAEVCVLLVLEFQFPKLVLLVHIVLPEIGSGICLRFCVHKPVHVQMTGEAVMIRGDHSTHDTGFVGVQNGNVLIPDLYAHVLDLA